MGNDKAWLTFLKVEPTEVEFLFSQDDVLKVKKDKKGEWVAGVADPAVAKGVCYALSYEWIRQGVKPEKSLKPKQSMGLHGRADMAHALHEKFKNTGEGDKPYGDDLAFCAAIGGSGKTLPQPIFSMQRALKAALEIQQAKEQELGEKAGAGSSAMATIAKSDGLTEHYIAFGPSLPKPGPFLALLKPINTRAKEFNKGYAQICFRGSSGGHAVAVQVAEGGVHRFFDPNLGVFRFKDYARFAKFWKEIMDEQLYGTGGYIEGAYHVSTFK